MMKKFFMASTMTVIVLSLLLISGCGGDKEIGTTGGVEGGANLLSFLPDSASGVFIVNFTEVAKLALFDEMIKKEEAKEEGADKAGKFFKNYEDFVTKTGIDPKKDIHGVAIALLGPFGASEPDAVVVASLNYDKEKVMAVIKQEGAEKLTEETYKDVVIFINKEEGEQGAFAFINENIVAAGKIEGVKKVIDLSKGEGQSIMTNAKMKSYIDKFTGLISFVINLPDEVKKVHDMGMAQVDLTKADVVLGHFNYSGNAYSGEISMICPNEEANNKLVTTLNNFKGMAAMMGPEAGEVANKINLTASADKVSLTFDISQELIEKLQQKMKEKGQDKDPIPPTESETE
jgi:hypothetical protein